MNQSTTFELHYFLKTIEGATNPRAITPRASKNMTIVAILNIPSRHLLFLHAPKSPIAPTMQSNKEKSSTTIEKLIWKDSIF